MRTTKPTTKGAMDFDDSYVVERPEGFYLRDKRTGAEFGPYATFLDAVAKVENNAHIEIESCEDIKEVEDELGIADWIDPDTGEPAEESVPHIEDH